MDDRDMNKNKENILNAVREYYRLYHQDKTKKKERITYAGRIYDEEEMCNLVESALEFWLTSGRYTDEFEEGFAKYLGAGYCSLVNSGSSANLLAFMALTSSLLKERAVEKGDEVITVAAGFPTTITPAIQFGAVPVFVDVTIPQYNINVELLEEARSEKTKAVMIAHTLGNPFNIDRVKQFCDKYHLWLIEDNCDALGSEYESMGEIKKTGTFGDIGTSSFYPPHHMTMGEGGAVYTSNPLLHKIIRSLRDWGRDCICPSGKDNTCGRRFTGQYGSLPYGYDHKYVYSHLGYNLKATDMQAAIGCAQLKKLPSFVEARRRNFNRLYRQLEDLQDEIILPKALKQSNPSWFGFLITCREGLEKNKVVEYLEKNGIQTRMLFAGNITRQPCFNRMRESGLGYRVVGELSATDQIMNHSFWVGVYPGMTEETMDYMAEMIHKGVRKAL